MAYTVRKELGYEGQELREWVTRQQEIQRADTNAEYEFEKAKVEAQKARAEAEAEKEKPILTESSWG